MEKNDDAVSKIEELRAELNILKYKKKKLDKKSKTKKADKKEKKKAEVKKKVEKKKTKKADKKEKKKAEVKKKVEETKTKEADKKEKKKAEVKKKVEETKTKEAEKKEKKKAEVKKKVEKKKTKEEKKEEEKTLEEQLEEQLSDEEIENFKIEKVDMEKLLAERESSGMIQSELWKKLKLTNQIGSRLALKLERMGNITREKILEKGRWTYKLILKKTPISTISIEDAPCLICPVEQKCTLEGEISPQTCVWIEEWVTTGTSKLQKP